MKKIQILAILDMSELCNIVKSELESTKKFNVLTVSKASEGLRMVKAHNPDILIIDITMPGLKGVEIAQQLIDKESKSGIPMIFLMPPVNGGDNNHYYNQIMPSFLRNLIKQIEKKVEAA
jgi:CheY-like chemotaxis protein